MAEASRAKMCFVIAPIGDEGTEIRRRSDQVLNHIVRPAARECGYEAVRADEISEPGIITSQVIQHLIDDDLVIADLTGKNANVFYELAVRHALKKPVVQIIQAGESIPFDVAPTRTIHVDHRDLDSVANCREELAKQIHSVERDPTNIESPISMAIDLQALHRSGNPLEKSTADIISMLQDLRSAISDSSATSRRGRADLGIIAEIFDTLAGIDSILDVPDGAVLASEQYERARDNLGHLMRLFEMWARQSGDVPPDILEHFMFMSPRRRRRRPST